MSQKLHVSVNICGICTEIVVRYKYAYINNFKKVYPKVIENYQDIPQSYTADQPMSLQGRTTQQLQSQGIRKTIIAQQLAMSLSS